MSILVTGFEPFGTVRFNPSEWVVGRLKQLALPGLATCVLPTSYRRAAAELVARLSLDPPRQVLLLGAAAGAQALRYEEVALNFDDASKPDNDGEVRRRQRIEPAGPAAYFSSLPFEVLAGFAERSGLRLESSRDAGAFVCNHALYTTLHWFAEAKCQASVGFLHLPLWSEEQLERVVQMICGWSAASFV